MSVGKKLNKSLYSEKLRRKRFNFLRLKKDNSFHEESARINSYNRKSDVKLVIKM